MKVIEKERIYLHPYTLPPGYIIQPVRNIVKIDIDEEGNHRIKTKEGETRFIHNDFVKIVVPKENQNEK